MAVRLPKLSSLKRTFFKSLVFMLSFTDDLFVSKELVSEISLSTSEKHHLAMSSKVLKKTQGSEEAA